MVSVNEVQDEDSLFELIQHIEEFKHFPNGNPHFTIEDYKRLLMQEIPIVPKL